MRGTILYTIVNFLFLQVGRRKTQAVEAKIPDRSPKTRRRKTRVGPRIKTERNTSRKPSEAFSREYFSPEPRINLRYQRSRPHRYTIPWRRNVPTNHAGFAARLFSTHGLVRISKQLFRFAELGLNHFTLLREKFARETNPLSHEIKEKFASNPEAEKTVRYLNSDQNLRYLISTLNFLASRAPRNYDQKIERAESQKRLEMTLRFLDALIRLIFIGKNLAAIRLERVADQKLRERKKGEELEEKKAEKRRQERKLQEREAEQKRLEKIRLLVEAGKIIERLTLAINHRSHARLAEALFQIIYRGTGPETITKNQAFKVIKMFCQAEPRKALPLLVEAAAYLKTNRFIPQESKTELLKLILEAAVEMLRSIRKKPVLQNKLILKLIRDFKEAHQNISLSINREELKAKVKIITNLLSKVPEALPYLLRQHSRHYSWIRAFAARIGIKSRDFTAQVLEPLILELAKTPKGENAVLRYFSASVRRQKASSPKVSQKLGRVDLFKKLAHQVVRNILTRAKGTTPAFVARDQAEEIKEALIEIAKENNFTPTELTANQALTLLLIAVNIQRLVEALRNGNEKDQKTSAEPGKLFGELKKMSGSRKYHSIKIAAPIFDLLKINLDGKNQKFSEPEHQIAYQIAKITGGNVFAARRVSDVLKSRPEIWGNLPDLTEEGKEHFIKYAYCFLTARQSGHQIKSDKDLTILIQQETDRKQLFMTLQYIPPAIREELINYFRKAFAESGRPGLALEIQILQKLLSINELARTNRRDLATRILLAVQEYGDGTLWSGILEMARNGNYAQIGEYFKDLIKNLKEREKDIPSIKLAIKATDRTSISSANFQFSS